MMMKAISQPLPQPMFLKYCARAGMHSGATRAPAVAPALKMDVAKARSRRGKYSVVTLMAEGKLPPSPRPRRMRAPMKNHTLTGAMVGAVAPVASSMASVPCRSSDHCVATPQSACRQAPVDHIPMAQR